MARVSVTGPARGQASQARRTRLGREIAVVRRVNGCGCGAAGPKRRRQQRPFRDPGPHPLSLTPARSETGRPRAREALGVCRPRVSFSHVPGAKPRWRGEARVGSGVRRHTPSRGEYARGVSVTLLWALAIRESRWWADHHRSEMRVVGPWQSLRIAGVNILVSVFCGGGPGVLGSRLP